jgi:aquaporin Z
MTRNVRILAAEMIGTFVLMLGGPGTAVLATGRFFPAGSVQVLGVAIGFGLSLLIMAYAIGNISGCHINPAVTLALWVTKKIDAVLVPFYVIGQLAGAALGGLVIWLIASGAPGNFDPGVKNFAVNGWANLSPGRFNFGAMVVTEIVMTALLAFVVLSTTHRKFSPAAGGLAVGLTLTVIHLMSIPIDNTSVNPARSFGMAIFAGGDAVQQLWAFFVFPLIGGALGAVAWWAIDDSRSEKEAPAATAVLDLREVADEPAQASEAPAVPVVPAATVTTD